LIVLDIGCRANGSSSCMNGGLCQENGVCYCKYGFSGPTCSECELNLLVLILNYFILFLI